MLLMQRLSMIAMLSAGSLFGLSDSEVVTYLKNGIGANPAISNLEIDINSKKKIPDATGWDAYFIEINADVKQNGTSRRITQGSIYFVNGNTITSELMNAKTGVRYNDTLTPDFNPTFYTKANLISGSEKSANKIAIFSDPLCPFCRKFVPEAISYMKKYPKTFAIYYYNLPLVNLHPASVTLVKAAIAAEQAGIDDATLKLYNVDIDANEKDEQKILSAFNKAVGSKITLNDIKKDSVLAQYNFDQKVVSKMAVAGTPTVFFNGVKDISKNRYKEIKVK